MQIIDLFSGLGGFSVASEWMGWETIQFCEIDENCQNLLASLFPNVPIHNDIKTLNCDAIKKRINPNKHTILVGGFPCQPFSAAGKQKGTEDERHLWPYMLRAIKQLRPRWVVGENVRGLVNWSDGLVFDTVQTNLENEGYEVFPVLLPACGVNAPHRRDRIWFVAHNNKLNGNTTGFCSSEIPQQQEAKVFEHSFAHARSNGQQPRRLGENKSSQGESESIEEQRKRVWSNFGGISGQENVADSKCEGLQKPKTCELGKQLFDVERNNSQNATNSPRIGMEGNRTAWEQKPGIQIEERLFGRNSSGTDWTNWPTQSPICGRNDGFPSESLRAFIRQDSNGNLSEEEIDKIFSAAYSKWRNATIKGYGNAIVPQVAYQIFKTIQDYENR